MRAPGRILTGDFLITWGSPFENDCGDLRRLSFPPGKRPTSFAETCGDDESAQKSCAEKGKSPGS